VIVFFAAGMLYPVLAGQARALVDTGRLTTRDRRAACLAGETWAGGGVNCPTMTPLRLDGAPTMVNSDEYAAIQCLSDLDKDRDAVLIEAPCHCGYHPEVGGFSALTGIPTLMGWGNHEGQWRGETLPRVTDTRVENGVRRDRFSDAQDLYTTQDWSRVWQVIDRYGIDFIVVGDAERNMIRDLAGSDSSLLREYELGLQKFEQVLAPVCQSGGTTVYRVRPE